MARLQRLIGICSVLLCLSVSSVHAAQLSPSEQQGNQLLIEGYKLAQQGNHAQAFEKYEQGIRLMPNSGKAHYYLARSLLVLKMWSADFQRAKDQLDDAIRLTPNSKEGKLAAAWQECVGKGNQDSRLASCSTITDSDEKDDQLLAMAFFFRGLAEPNCESAVVDYDRALAQRDSPVIVGAALNQGQCYVKLNQFNKAIRSYDLGLKYNSTTSYVVSRATEGRGEAYYGLGDYDRALVDLNQAISSDPNYAYAYRVRAKIFTSKGDSTRALQDNTRAGQLEKQ